MEGAQPTGDTTSGEVVDRKEPSLESYKEEIQVLQKEIERLNAVNSDDAQPLNSLKEVTDRNDELIKLCENDTLPLSSGIPSESSESMESHNAAIQNIEDTADKQEESSKSDDNFATDATINVPKDNVVPNNGLLPESNSPSVDRDSENKVIFISFKFQNMLYII